MLDAGVRVLNMVDLTDVYMAFLLPTQAAGTVVRSMPQMGLLLLIILLPPEMMFGGFAPPESMPMLVQTLMLAAPTRHFVALAQAIFYRGAGIGIVWTQFLALIAVGGVFFVLGLSRFRKTISSMA